MQYKMNSRRAAIFVIGTIYCVIINTCVLVEGRYLLEVGLYGYSNPTGRCRGCLAANTGQRGCCDRFATTTCSDELQCDSFFTYCLGNEQGGCASGTQRRSEVNIDDGILDFSQSSVLGLENPLIISGSTDAYTQVQLRVVVRDEDPEQNNPNELVDQLLIDHDLPVGETSSRQNYTGIYDFEYVTMDLTIKVLCDTNFQGSDCTQCVPGFTGAMCNRNINDCRGETCSDNGQCVDGVNSFACNCDPGFTGAQCETNINECAGVNCSGNGVCEDGIDTFTCNCEAGFTGDQCQTNINECEGVSCGRHGQCVDLVNSFMCACTPGFTGQFCEEDINECQSTNCSGHGQCTDGINSFTCACETGFTGQNCEINVDDCVGVSCNGNGQCVDGVVSYTCDCDFGFTGMNCEINIDDCVGVNCSGNGNCLDGVNSFTCECSSGFSGLLCAEEFRSNNQTGPIVGGVLGVVISIILILILVVAVVLIMRCNNCHGKPHIQGRKMDSNALPGDNPIYEGGDMAISLGGIPWTTLPVHSGVERADSALNREFANPIYGRNETENVYSNIDNHQTGIGTGPVPYHTFHYHSDITDEDIYSMPSNSSSLSADGRATDVGQIVYENTTRVTGREQVYDQII